MPLTIAVTATEVTGTLRRHQGTMAFDAAYPTGGEPFDPRQVGMTRVTSMVVDAGNGYLFTPNLNATPPTIQALVVGAGAGPLVEAAAGTNLAAVTNVPWVATGW